VSGRSSPQSRSRETRKLRPWLEHLPVFIAAAAWIALFINNIGILPPRVGFDFEAHRAYVRYILDHHALPLASQGWEMYQPPLYYVACALWLKLLGLSTADQGGLVAIRCLGFAVGLAHLLVLWATLRLLFPGQRVAQWAGLTLAATLPPLLYLGEYVSNEAPSAALYTMGIYFTLRILRSEQPSWKLYLGLGFCLGTAMLAKASAILLFPPVFGALIWKLLLQKTAVSGKREEGRGKRVTEDSAE
jgi:4-amino-4-deoxy-L-arabinose transferase-like glycosyltransferase